MKDNIWRYLGSVWTPRYTVFYRFPWRKPVVRPVGSSLNLVRRDLRNPGRRFCHHWCTSRKNWKDFLQAVVLDLLQIWHLKLFGHRNKDTNFYRGENLYKTKKNENEKEIWIFWSFGNFLIWTYSLKINKHFLRKNCRSFIKKLYRFFFIKNKIGTPPYR